MRRSPAVDGLFLDGNPATGQLGTVVNAAWLNMIQAEIISVLTAAGITVDAAKSDQLATAVNTLLRGRATINCAGGASIALSAGQSAMPILVLTGALTANINLIFPNSTGSWIVRNQTTGAFSVTCKTAAGTGVVVSQNTSNALWGDGTNIYPEQSDWANLVLAGICTALTAADGTNTTQLATTAFVQNAVGGYLAKAVTGGTVTLTDAEASNPVIAFTGALTSNLIVIVPATVKRLWAINNGTTGAFTLTVKTAAGTGVTVAQGKRNLIYTDGTNVYDGFNDFESIALTGAPTTPTPAPGVPQQVANMEAVAKAMGSYRGYRNLTASVALSAADVGFYIGISATGLTVTLPAGASVPVGSTFTFGANSAFTIAAAAGNAIASPTGPGLTSAVMSGFCSIVWRGDFWQVVMGGDRSGTNFLMFPGGNIVQWGSIQVAANSTGIATYPVAFPNGCLSIVGSRGAAGSNAAFNFSPVAGSKSQFSAQNYGTGLEYAHWIAIGN